MNIVANSVLYQILLSEKQIDRSIVNRVTVKPGFYKITGFTYKLKASVPVYLSQQR